MTPPTQSKPPFRSSTPLWVKVSWAIVIVWATFNWDKTSNAIKKGLGIDPTITWAEIAFGSVVGFVTVVATALVGTILTFVVAAIIMIPLVWLYDLVKKLWGRN